VRVVTVSPGFIETDAATRMIARMATGDGSDYATARQRLVDMLGCCPARPAEPAGALRSSSTAAPIPTV
jgi:NAD(P)-dependent dehydrogenase (short-subunit alcohol dehydrogenase family)